MTATRHHTRASCDECGGTPAPRETAAGVFCETCESDTPRAANDDAQGASCDRPLCKRCSEPAFLRFKEGDLCSECFAKTKSDSSFAAATSGENVTAASKPAPAPAAVVTNISQLPRGGSPVTVGVRMEPAPAVTPNSISRPSCARGIARDQANAGESAHDLEVRIGAAGKGPRLSSPERGRAAASDTADQISSSGDGLGNQEPRSITWGGSAATPAPSGRARDRAICPAVSGNSSCGGVENSATSDNVKRQERVAGLETRSATIKRRGSATGPQDSNPLSASAPPPATADASSKLATLRQDAVFSSVNTPEASGTTRKVPSTGCGTSPDVGTQSAPRPLLDFEAEVSALEKSDLLNGPVYVGIDLSSGPDICLKYEYDPASRTIRLIGAAEQPNPAT
jgi:hypothetical protein